MLLLFNPSILFSRHSISSLSNSNSQNEHRYSFSKIIQIGTLNGKAIDNYLTLQSKLDFNGFDILSKDRGRDSRSECLNRSLRR